MTIKDIEIDQIKPYENNPRKNDGAVDAVAESIRQFGWKQPIVIDKDGVIVAEHTRYKAAQKLGCKTVPCVMADDLTKEQVRAYRLADNKTADLADWDFLKLDEELKSIFDIDMGDFGFSISDDDLKDMFTDAKSEGETIDEGSPDTQRKEDFELEINGKYKNEKRWISREDFYRLKDSDPYVKYCWSFGTAGSAYLYSKGIEPYKKAIHEMLVAETVKERRLKWRAVYFMSHEALKNDQSMHGYECQSLEGLERLQSLEGLERLQSLGSLGRRVQGLERLNGDFKRYGLDYQAVPIPANSVIYCDIPYHGTDGYDGDSAFDYDRFYSWAQKQENIYISEYWMPGDEFDCVKEIDATTGMQGGAQKRIEKIFVPKR